MPCKLERKHSSWEGVALRAFFEVEGLLLVAPDKKERDSNWFKEGKKITGHNDEKIWG